jgi:hypothetical protein
MRVALAQFPSSLMGEGSGGGEDSPPSPHPNVPPQRGEVVFTSPCQHRGEGKIWARHRSTMEV